MKKILSLAAFALMTSMMFVACSSGDDDPVQPAPTPAPTPEPEPEPTPANPFLGTWNLINDVDPTIVTELVMSTNPIIDYSAANTSQNPSIPAGTPTYVMETKPNPNYTDPWVIVTTYSKEQGYFTMPAAVTDAAGNSTIPSSGMVTFWPQSSMTSNDGSTWTAVPVADMAKMIEYEYVLNGNVMVLTKGDKTTQTFITVKGTPAATVPGDAFFKTWILPSDADPTTTVNLVMSATPYTDYSAPGTQTNPTIPANALSYTKTTKVDPNVIDPWAGGTASYTKDMGYFTIPDETTTTAEGTSVTTRPATGTISFWLQRQWTSTDGSTWTETPAADLPANLEEYTYSMNGNVMVLTKADKTTVTYYTIIPQ